jgi:hypothetical protein
MTLDHEVPFGQRLGDKVYLGDGIAFEPASSTNAAATEAYVDGLGRRGKTLVNGRFEPAYPLPLTTATGLSADGGRATQVRRLRFTAATLGDTIRVRVDVPSVGECRSLLISRDGIYLSQGRALEGNGTFTLTAGSRADILFKCDGVVPGKRVGFTSIAGTGDVMGASSDVDGTKGDVMLFALEFVEPTEGDPTADGVRGMTIAEMESATLDLAVLVPDYLPDLREWKGEIRRLNFTYTQSPKVGKRCLFLVLYAAFCLSSLLRPPPFPPPSILLSF